MADYYDAFEVSPVRAPALDATPPEVQRGIYGMPMFVTVPTSDLAASVDFWVRGLGFIDLFTIPGRLTHLRRWAFQDVLLVPSGRPADPPRVSVSFACVLSQVDGIAQACATLLPGCTSGPRQTPWNTVDLEVVTPENARVIMTAARPLDPDSVEARNLEAAGFETVVVSPQNGEIKGWQHDHWGDPTKVDLTLDEAEAADFDALMLPGGQMNPDKLRMEDKAVQLVKDFCAAGKPVAAICHGPWLLVEADVVRGKTVTSWPSVRTDLKNAGANVIDQEVATDGNLITSRKPDDIPAFSEALIAALQDAKVGEDA